MIELSIERFSQVTSFFDKPIPNFPVVMSVIEGNNPGKIWVDQIENPSICLVITKGSYSFIGKKDQINESSILKVIDILKKNKPIKLILELNDPLFDLFQKAGFAHINRIQFYHSAMMNHDLTQIDAICDRLPLDCQIKSIDAALLKKSSWLAFITQIYGTEENFLKHGYGLALIQKGELISEAFACFIGGGYVETGSVTAEQHQGKGYSTLVRAFLIKESLLRNLRPNTSCNADNMASARVSEKLGFKEEKRYQFLII